MLWSALKGWGRWLLTPLSLYWWRKLFWLGSSLLAIRSTGLVDGLMEAKWSCSFYTFCANFSGFICFTGLLNLVNWTPELSQSYFWSRKLSDYWSLLGDRGWVTCSSILVLSLPQLFHTLKKTYIKKLSWILCFLLENLSKWPRLSLLEADVSYMFSDCSLITFLGICSQTCQYIFSTNPKIPFPKWFKLRFFFTAKSKPALSLLQSIQRYTGKGHASSPSSLIHLTGSDLGQGEEVLWSWPHLATWLVQLDVWSYRHRISEDSFIHLNHSFHPQILFH